MTIFDYSGIEAWVTESNPKFANRIIKQLKAYAKANHFNSSFAITYIIYCNLLNDFKSLGIIDCIFLSLTITTTPFLGLDTPST